MYPVIRVDGWWYIFQKLRNPNTKKWEGGTATQLAPTIFGLNPDLDPFKGDLLRQLVIRPIEEELDLLVDQVHEAPDDEPEPETHQTESPQESDASIPDRPKRMSAVTLTPTQSTITTALTSRSGPPPSGSAPGLTGGGGGGGGGGPVQPAAAQSVTAHQGNGKLEGKEPTIFTGDRAKADEFMHELKLYQFLNSTTPVMTDPY